MLSTFVFAVFIHLLIDFFLQPTWIALNKHQPWKHPAGWLHAAAHGLGLFGILTWEQALTVAVVHLFIDTYIPVALWVKWVRPDLGTFKRPGPTFWPVVIWADQTLHLLTLYLVIVRFG